MHHLSVSPVLKTEIALKWFNCLDTKFSPTCNSSFKWTSLLLHSGGFWRTLTAILGLCKTFISMQMKKIKIAFVITFQNLLSLIFLSNLKSFSIFFWTLKLYHVIQKFECYLRNKTEHFLNLSIKTNQKYWILTFWRTHRFQISQAKTRRKNVQKCNFWHLKWTNKSLSTIGIMGNYRLCSPPCDQYMIFEVSA